MNKIVCGVMIFIVLGTVSGCGKNEESTAEEVTHNNENTTAIYLTKLNAAQIGALSDELPNYCGDNFESVTINKKLSPQEALEELFAYKDYNKEEGLRNVFETFKGVKIESLLIQNDFAVLTLSDGLELDKAFNSTCAYTQIEKTLTQFDDIAGVDIFVGDQEFGSYILENTLFI